MTEGTEAEDDVKAISVLIAALKPLNAESRVHVLDFVLKKLGITLVSHHVAPAQVLPAPVTPAVSTIASSHNHNSPSTQDIRTFAAEKKPKTVNERVAIVGYYISQLAPEGERRDYLVSDDIKTYFIQAGFELPTASPAMTLSNAKNAGYLNAMDRGQYKLNAVGHNLVAHKLPNEASETRRRTSSRKATKKVKARKKAGK